MVKTRRSTPSQRRSNREQEPVEKSFFKIILPSTIQRKMLRIPGRFVRLGPKLKNTVTVETPLGFKRLIRLKRIGEEIWFGNGWNEFAEIHCISEGYLVVFHYIGNSSFRVVIFDKSASEINYPLDEVNVSDDGDDDDDDEEGFVVSEFCNELRKEVIVLD